MTTPWHYIPLQKVYEELKTSDRGLTTADAASRIETYGHNVIAEKKPEPLIIKFLNQFKSVLIIVLIGGNFILGVFPQIVGRLALEMAQGFTFFTR